LKEAKDDTVEQELAVADRRNKREIRHLEQELPKWQVLVDSVTGIHSLFNLRCDKNILFYTTTNNNNKAALLNEATFAKTIFHMYLNIFSTYLHQIIVQKTMQYYKT
jgi:hypothetical protein